MPARRSGSASAKGDGSPGSSGGRWPRSRSTAPPTASHGLRSGGPQTERAMIPPGRRTRRAPSRAASGSSMSMMTKRATHGVHRAVGQVDALAVHDAVLDVARPDLLRPAAAELDHRRATGRSRSAGPPRRRRRPPAGRCRPRRRPARAPSRPGTGASAATSHSRTGASSPSMRARRAAPTQGPWPPRSRRAWTAALRAHAATVASRPGYRVQHAPDRGPEGTLG